MFELLVTETTHVDGVQTVEGILVRGRILHGTRARANTTHGVLVIFIRTVAFLCPALPDHHVLTIDPPAFEPSWLHGATLGAVEVTPLEERENAERIAEDDLYQRPSSRTCLVCGGMLQVNAQPSGYEVICTREQRVLLKARGV